MKRRMRPEAIPALSDAQKKLLLAFYDDAQRDLNDGIDAAVWYAEQRWAARGR